MIKDLTELIETKEELPIHWAQSEPAAFLQHFISKLHYLNELLAKNSYVKETTKVLHYIIQDASNSTMVLLTGMAGAGTTSLVNALLGRTILKAKIGDTSGVTSIICYGEKEEVRAYFLDGQVASFDLGQVELFTSLNTSSAKILREGLDFIEIYVRHDLLKFITLILSTPSQISGIDTAYIKESVINRADDVFWVLKYNQKMVQEEINFLNRLKDKNFVPLGILNGIDLIEKNISYDSKLSTYVRDIIGVSAKDALTALQDNNDDLWKQSQMDLLVKELEKTANNHAKRLSYITGRFIHWLNRFQIEIEMIPEREPYHSSLLTLKQYIENFESNQTKESSQNEHLVEAVSNYKKQSAVFQEISTLYQLIQLIETKPFREVREAALFKTRGEHYLASAREYRKQIHAYKNTYAIIDKKHRKITGKDLLNFIIGKRKEDSYFHLQIQQLNEQQEILEKKHHLLKLQEEQLFSSFDEVQKLLNQFVQDQLEHLSKEFSTIEYQRQKDNANFQNAIKKLEGFDSIVEAQTFLLKLINEYVLNDDFILTKEENNQLEHSIHRIGRVNLSYSTYIEQCKQLKPINHEKIQTLVVENHPYYPLQLTLDDIRVEIEEPPQLVELNK